MKGRSDIPLILGRLRLLVFGYISIYISLSDDCHVKICKLTAFSSGSFCQIYRVTDEALIAKTAVWPNFFLMNVFFALKGSKLFIIISKQLTNSQVLSQCTAMHVGTV